MKSRILTLALILFLAISFPGRISAQEIEDGLDNPILYYYEKSGYVSLFGDGWGLGFRYGKHQTVYRKWNIEVELQANKSHPKEIKSLNILFNNSKKFVYGKLNYFSVLRTGLGIQRTLNDKPYFGGVEVRYYLGAGLSSGLTRPYYLYILNYTDTYDQFYLTDEAYDPDKHYIGDIYGRGPFGKGFGELKYIPGAYLKFGFNFEFGDYDESVRALEAGAVLDVFGRKVPMMAYNSNPNIFLGFYVSFHMGKRYNR